MFSLKEKEVNTGRQRELDLVKGFLLIMIVFIHSFQTIGGVAAAESNVHKILFALFMPTGACLYLFTMGFGSAFTRHSQPKDMVKNGIKLLFYQGLSNLCYAAVMTISFNREMAQRAVSDPYCKMASGPSGRRRAYHERKRTCRRDYRKSRKRLEK